MATIATALVCGCQIGATFQRFPNMYTKPKHALAAVLQFGVAGWTWRQTADFLNMHNLRTSTRRRWTAGNVRVHFCNIATHALKLARGRAIERKRGFETSYMKAERLNPRVIE